MRFWVIAFVCWPCVAGAASVQSFDLPGSARTCGSDIANNGLVAGNAAGTALADARPFLYQHRQFQQPVVGVALPTILFNGVNKHGTIAGNAFEINFDNSSFQGFIDKRGMLFQPTAGGQIVAGVTRITDVGTILGTLALAPASQFSFSRTIGFTTTKTGVVSTIDDGATLSVTPVGIDLAGDHVVGYSIDTVLGLHGWSYAQGSFTPVSYPGASVTVPSGVNNAGVISGSYFIGPISVNPPSPSHGFVWQNGAYTAFDVAGASSTTINGMNEAGHVTGCYTDSSGTHGFLAKP